MYSLHYTIWCLMAVANCTLVLALGFRLGVQGFGFRAVGFRGSGVQGFRVQGFRGLGV